jgi:hypothetical protein
MVTIVALFGWLGRVLFKLHWQPVQLALRHLVAQFSRQLISVALIVVCATSAAAVEAA